MKQDEICPRPAPHKPPKLGCSINLTALEWKRQTLGAQWPTIITESVSCKDNEETVFEKIYGGK